VTTVYDFSARLNNTEQHELAHYHDKVLLIVNTASQCGFTGQYAGLEQLYRQYCARGLVVLGFPCNQFRQQEPGSDQQIATFCQTHYDISFPLFSKIEVNGAHAHPLFRYLKHQAPGLFGTTAIKWNFTKFLVNRQGHAVQRFGPPAKPDTLTQAIEQLL